MFPLRLDLANPVPPLVTVAGLSVTARRCEGGVQYAVVAAASESPTERIPDSSWHRYLGEVADVLEVSAALPELPVVVYPPKLILVGAECEVELYVSLPPILTISAASVLEEVPTQALGRTWLGSPLEGRLCYALSAHLSTDAKECCGGVGPDGERGPDQVLSPIRVRNNTGVGVQIDRLVALTPQLSLLQEDNGSLYTNASINVMQRDGETSFSLGRDRLRTDGAPLVVSAPRNPDEDSWWRRGFELIQKISSYG